MGLVRQAQWRWGAGSGYSQKDLVITHGFSSGAGGRHLLLLDSATPTALPNPHVPSSRLPARTPASPSAQYGALSAWFSLDLKACPKTSASVFRG